MTPSLILLDIDGVLNSARTLVGLGASYPPLEPFNAAALPRGDAEHPQHPAFDPVAVALLRRLCDESGASLYVHSSWANRRTAAYLRDLFRVFYNWEAPVVERVPVYDYDRAARIRRALDHYRPERFAILDDDTRLCEAFAADGFISDNLVCVDADEGLLLCHYERALTILTGRPPSPILIAPTP